MPRAVLFTDHAIQRCIDHFAFAPSRAEQCRTFLSIIEGDALLLESQCDGREIYAATLHGMPCRLVYQPATASVVTVLPSLALQDARRHRRFA